MSSEEGNFDRNGYHKHLDHFGPVLYLLGGLRPLLIFIYFCFCFCSGILVRAEKGHKKLFAQISWVASRVFFFFSLFVRVSR